MKRATRNQGSYEESQDLLSRETAIDFTDAEDVARQEFAADADIANILQKHGIYTPQLLTPPTYGDIDTDLDLTEAYAVMDTLDQAWPSLPESVRDKYSSWAPLLEDIYAGKLTTLAPADIPKETPEQPPSEPQS